VLVYLGYSFDTINERLAGLQPVDMRLQLKHGANGCTLINDSYSADLTSLQLALHFMNGQQTGQPRTVILSDFAETGAQPEPFYAQVAAALESAAVSKCILVGSVIGKHLRLPSSVQVHQYSDTESFLNQYQSGAFPRGDHPGKRRAALPFRAHRGGTGNTRAPDLARDRPERTCP
jgi:UDP-N-acetylmuramyl pentapeptide synthase